MRSFLAALAFSCVFAVAAQAQQGGAQPAQPGVIPAPPADVAQLRQKVGYMIGYNMGRQLNRDKIDIDNNQLLKGVSDGLTGGKSPFTDEEVQQAFTQFRQIMADRVKNEGAAFLAKNKTTAGVTTLPSGLQYKVIKQGAGATPKVTDTVRTHYKGTLIDGTQFDSSIDRGQPAEFPVNGVIKGWVEALQLMKVGDKWQLFVPSTLGYGAQGTPDGAIPPDSVLVFEIELLGIANK